MGPVSRGGARQAEQFGDQPEMHLATRSSLLTLVTLRLDGSQMEKRLTDPSNFTDEDVDEDGDRQRLEVPKCKARLKSEREKQTNKITESGQRTQSQLHGAGSSVNSQSCKAIKRDKWSLCALLADFLCTSKSKVSVSNLLLTLERFWLSFI
jgi:hypothetical protein